MDTPLRRSRRLGGPKAEPPESPTAAPQARRALAEFESSLEEAREPASPRRVRQPGLASPRRQPETRPGSPRLGQAAGLGSPRRQPASSPERPRQEPKPSGETPHVLGSRGGPGARELAPRPLQHQPSGPGSPEPHPGQQAPGPEPSPPPPELASDGLCPKERTGPSAQAPAPKKRKEEAEVPIVPKGKPKSGRVWKDRAKKR